MKMSISRYAAVQARFLDTDKTTKTLCSNFEFLDKGGGGKGGGTGVPGYLIFDFF